MKVVLKNLTKVFPGRGKDAKDVTAVNRFDFEIPDGKLIALLGPSGCGKSTTLYMICGLLKPTEGQIFFGDDDVTNLPTENRGVGLVFQNYALYPHLTVGKNISFPLENLKGNDKLSKDEIKARVLESAKIVQIENLLDRKPKELSGGQQQRVAIARALVKKPPVLLLDEPLSNLDARLRLQTREELRRIQKETGITTIFVTHDQDEAMSISDLIVVMKDGTVQQIGKPQEVYENPANLFVAKFLGTPPINVFDGKVLGKPDTWVGIRPEGFVVRGDLIGDSRKETNIASKELTNPHREVGDANETAQSDRQFGGQPTITCNVERVEVQGRDISLVMTHPDFQGVNIRAIVDSDDVRGVETGEMTFGMKANKVFYFDKQTEQRI